jgi:hypothetical protein
VARGPRIAFALPALALLALSANAGAQPQARPRWLALLKEGRELMNRGSYAEACPKLAESVRIAEKVVTIAKLADCEERLGELAAALAHWKRARAVAQATSDDGLARIEQELARVDGIVPKLRIVGAGVASVAIDGRALTRDALSEPLLVDPGPHTVVAREAGRPAMTTTVVTESGGAEITVDIPALQRQAERVAHAAPARAAPPPQPTLAPDRAGTLRIAGLAVAGAGLASLAAGGVLDLMALSKNNASNATGAVNLSTVSAVFVVAGGALTAGGATVWLLAPKREAPPSAAWLGIAPTAGGVVARGAW